MLDHVAAAKVNLETGTQLHRGAIAGRTVGGIHVCFSRAGEHVNEGTVLQLWRHGIALKDIVFVYL